MVKAENSIQYLSCRCLESLTLQYLVIFLSNKTKFSTSCTVLFIQGVKEVLK